MISRPLPAQLVDQNRAGFDAAVSPPGLDGLQRQRALTGTDLEHLAGGIDVAHQQAEARTLGSAAAGTAKISQLFLSIGKPAVEGGGHCAKATPGEGSQSFSRQPRITSGRGS